VQRTHGRGQESPVMRATVPTRIVLALLGMVMAGTVSAAPVTDALQRPALLVRDPAHAVLLNAAAAGNRIVAVGERGIVTVSDDNGTHWRQIATPVSVTLTMVRFVDSRNGVAIGHGGIVLTTTDSGNSWVKRLDGKQAAEISLDAARASGYAGQLKVAEQFVADGPDKPFFDVILFDSRRLVVVGAYGLAFESDDGGQHWTSFMQRLDNPKGLHLYAARQNGDEVAIAGEQGLVLLSRDRGRTFKRIETPYKGSYFTVEIPAPGKILVAGLRGNVWRSFDAGGTWKPVASNMPVTITASTVLDGTTFLANQAGFILRVRGDGIEAINVAPIAMPSGLLAFPDGRLLATGVEGVSQVPLATR
jgi:photosystem II stability/assembly factor-like uncharacterized protein